MATTQAILDDINLRYRNTFSVSQILVWFNEEQRELFDVLELDSPPYTFVTVADENFYPFPQDFDVTKIKVVTFQIDDTVDPTYIEIPFKRNDDFQFGNIGVWWTIVSDAFFLYVADGVPVNRNVYIYCDSDPVEVTTATLGVAPSLPTKFLELLKLGTLKRIAMARKDVTFYQNYLETYDLKITDILWERKLAEPEWIQPIDNAPRAGNPYGYGSYRYGLPYWQGSGL